jgi:hypothetical protein
MYQVFHKTNWRKASVEAGNRFFGDRGGPCGRWTHLPRHQTVPVATASTRAGLRKSEAGCDRNADFSPDVFFTGGRCTSQPVGKPHADPGRTVADGSAGRHEGPSVGQQLRDEICTCAWHSGAI